MNLQYDLHADRHRSAAAMRRAVVALEAQSTGAWDARVEFDLVPQALVDVRVRRRWDNGMYWVLGQYKQAMLQDEQVSNRNTLFMESALGQALVPGRRLGVALGRERPGSTAGVGFYGQDLRGRKATIGMLGRVSTAWPGAEGRSVLAASAAIERPRESFRLSTRPEANLHAEFAIDSGSLHDARSVRRAGIEAAWIEGACVWQSEWIGLQVRRNAHESLHGHAVHAQFACLSSGARRSFRGGVLQAPQMQGQANWEWGLRHSRIALGSEQWARQWTLGASLWVGDGRRLAVNRVFSSRHHAIREQISEVRLQFVL